MVNRGACRGAERVFRTIICECHCQDSRWTFASLLTESLRLRGRLIRTGPWSSLINDGVNTQDFLLKNRKVGAGRLQSIRRIYRHSWKNSGSCCAVENQVTSKRACAVMTGCFRWFLIRFEPFRDETGKIAMWYGVSTDIENLKQTEEKLREDERELRQITDAIPQTIVVQDPGGVPIYANQATLDYTGLTADDVIAPNFRERIFHPEDLEKLRNERKAALARGLPFEFEHRALRKDGQYRWFLIRYNPF